VKVTGWVNIGVVDGVVETGINGVTTGVVEDTKSVN